MSNTLIMCCLAQLLLATEAVDQFVLTFLGPSYLWRRREALRRDEEFNEFDFTARGANFRFEHRFAEPRVPLGPKVVG